jgi:hypothetical protein
VRKLSLSTSHVIKIQKGEANLTIASLARIAAVIKKTSHFQKINLNYPSFMLDKIIGDHTHGL